MWGMNSFTFTCFSFHLQVRTRGVWWLPTSGPPSDLSLFSHSWLHTVQSHLQVLPLGPDSGWLTDTFSLLAWLCGED